jgi:GAF domain-containing protein
LPLALDRVGITAWAKQLTDALAEDPHFHQIGVLIHDSEVNGLRLVDQRWGPSVDLGLLVPGEWIVPLAGSICGRVFRTGIPALCSDIAIDPDYLSFSGGQTKSELTVPIVVGGRPIGVVNIEAPWLSAFGIADLELVRRHIKVATDRFPLVLGEKTD